MGKAKLKIIPEAKPLKLDLGCGTRKQEGFEGIDIIGFKGVDRCVDLRQTPWPWEDGSVDEVFSSHFVEHLTGLERVTFFNELYRVLKVGAKATIITPNWSHACAYGDPTHQWPPISEWYLLYLNKAWREREAPHAPYTCDFDFVTGIGFDQWLLTRNDEFKMFAAARYVNSQRDLHANLTKRAPS